MVNTLFLYHIKSKKTKNGNIQLEWLKAVRTKKNNFRIVLKHTGHFLLTLSAKTFIMHLRLSSYRL